MLRATRSVVATLAALCLLCSMVVAAQPNAAMDELLQKFMQSGDVASMLGGALNGAGDLSKMVGEAAGPGAADAVDAATRFAKEFMGEKGFDWDKLERVLKSPKLSELAGNLMEDEQVQSLAKSSGLDLSKIGQMFEGDTMSQMADAMLGGNMMNFIETNPDISKMVESLGMKDVLKDIKTLTEDSGLVNELKSLAENPQALGSLLQAFGGGAGGIGGGQAGAVSQLLQQLSAHGGGNDMSALLQSLGVMPGLGGAPDPGARLRMMQQMMSGQKDQSGLLQLVQNALASNDGTALEMLRQLGLGDIDVNSPEEADARARLVLSKLQTMLAGGGFGQPKEVAVPMYVLWVVVFALFATMAFAIVTLVNVRAERAGKQRKKHDKKKLK